MNMPKKNLAESVLARAEAFRRGLLFDGMPSFGGPDLQLPPAPSGATVGAPPPEGAGGALPAAAPGATDELVAGAVQGNSPLETMVQP